MTELIQVCNLTKKFNNVNAVNDISFSVKSGQCLGLLGPNGAGKTTTVEMLEGISIPTSGRILYKGQPLDTNFKEQAGIMFQETALQEFITVYEILNQFQQLYKKSIAIDQLINWCDLSEFLSRNSKNISGGQRQRLLLAIALINDPEILFLDEPTTGLDPQARRKFWSLIRNIKSFNKTIILTTHYMEEAYNLCDEIIIMDHGNIIAQGTPRELLEKHFNDIIIELPRPTNLSILKQNTDITILQSNDMHEIITNDVTKTLKQLLDLGISLKGLKVRERTLEDLFIELTSQVNRS